MAGSGSGFREAQKITDPTYPDPEHCCVRIPIERVPGDEDESGGGDLLPLPLHLLLKVHRRLRRGAAHPRHVTCINSTVFIVKDAFPSTGFFLQLRNFARSLRLTHPVRAHSLITLQNPNYSFCRPPPRLGGVTAISENV